MGRAVKLGSGVAEAAKGVVQATAGMVTLLLWLVGQGGNPVGLKAYSVGLHLLCGELLPPGRGGQLQAQMDIFSSPLADFCCQIDRQRADDGVPGLDAGEIQMIDPAVHLQWLSAGPGTGAGVSGNKIGGQGSTRTSTWSATSAVTRAN